MSHINIIENMMEHCSFGYSVSNWTVIYSVIGWDTRYKTSEILSEHKRMNARKQSSDDWRDRAWNLYIQPFSSPLAIVSIYEM